MGQQDLRGDHHWVWNNCPLEHPMIKIQSKRQRQQVEFLEK
jgi:hypothetical protein